MKHLYNAIISMRIEIITYIAAFIAVGFWLIPNFGNIGAFLFVLMLIIGVATLVFQVNDLRKEYQSKE